MLINKISVPGLVTPFKPSMIELPIVVRVSTLVFLDTFDRNINNEVDEINIILISDLKDITFFHYMDQLKSMIQRKLERNFIEENFGDFDYKWLPSCVRHINT